MSKDRLDKFEAYQMAEQLFDLVVEDITPLARRTETARLVSQQIAAADSISANIEEGYGRGSRKEFIQFLQYSRGSVREVRGRYHRMRHWLDANLVEERMLLCSDILGKITRTIETLRTRKTRPPVT